MNKATFKASLLAVLALYLLPIWLFATPHTLRNDLLKLEAVQLIEDMGEELLEKTDINTYVIATNEHFPERFNLVAYSKQFEAKLNKPYVLFIFAPYAVITQKSEVRGRVGIIPSSKRVKEMYDYDDVRDAAIDIVALKDGNTKEDKFNVGVLQAYSELADEIASSQGITLTKTIPNEVAPILNILRVLIYIGTLAVFWIFIIRPLWMRLKRKK